MTTKKTTIATLIGAGALLLWSLAAMLFCQLKRLPLFEIGAVITFLGFCFTAIRLTVTKRWYVAKQPIIVWIVGIIGIFFNNLLLNGAIRMAPVAHVDLINYTWPLLIGVLSGLLPKERFSPVTLVSGAVGFFGVYTLVAADCDANPLCTENLYGYGVAFLAALSWTTYTLFMRHHRDLPTEMVGLFCGLAALFNLSLHLTVEQTVIPNGNESIVLILFGFLVCGVAYSLWDFAVKKGEIKTLSMFSFGTPIASIMWLVIFGICPATPALAFATLMVVAASLISYNDQRIRLAIKAFIDGPSSKETRTSVCYPLPKQELTADKIKELIEAVG